MTGAPFLVEVAANYVSPILAHVIQVLLVGSVFACALSLHNVISRYQFVLARSRTLPSWLAKVHPVQNSPHRSSLIASIITGVAVIGCAISGTDPLVGVMAWFGGVSAVGFYLLLFMTCLSTLVFFARNRHLDRRVWNTKIAPAAGLIGLVLMLAITIVNFPVLAGGTWAIALPLILIVPIAAIAGAVLARVFKARYPDRYEAIVDLTVSTSEKDAAPALPQTTAAN